MAFRRDQLSDLIRAVDEPGPRLMGEHRVPGVQAAVALGGRVVVDRAWGVADLATATPLRPDHVFKACSNAKPLAAMIALRLCDRGVLDLDSPIWRYVRSWKIPADRCAGHDPQGVTLRRLLCHQSGFSLRGFPQMDWPAAHTPGARELMDGCFGDAFTPRLTSEPGTLVAYGGDNTTLAQLAMEETTGRPIRELFERLIAAPLRLRSIWLGRRQDRAHRLVTGHLDDDRPEPDRFYPAIAASGLYTTAADLAMTYARLSRLLGPIRAGEAVSPQAYGENRWAFGLGFAVAECHGRRVYKHAGWSDSHWGAAEGVGPRVGPEAARSRIVWPRAAAAVLCNSARGKDVCMSLLGAISQWVSTRGV